MVDTIEPRGPWSLAQIRAFLADSVIPVRLATNTASGYPTVLSLWFVPDAPPVVDGSIELWCAVHASSRLASHLERDGSCAFEVGGDAPPYHGVRGQARAALVPARGEEILRMALERYLGGTDSDLARWLLSRADDELAIRLTAVTLFTWDYRKRMAGAV